MIPSISARTSVFWKGRTLNFPRIFNSDGTKNKMGVTIPATTRAMSARLSKTNILFRRLDGSFDFETPARGAPESGESPVFGTSRSLGESPLTRELALLEELPLVSRSASLEDSKSSSGSEAADVLLNRLRKRRRN